MENSSFFNAEKNSNGTYDRTYNAEDWAAYFSTFIGNGVSINPETCLQVEKTTGLNVLVNSGVAFINGYRYENTTLLTVKINEANASYDRITSIILELNLNTREIICTTLDGVAEQHPTAPSLTRTQSLYQLQLATVYVPAGGINCGVITDTRENKEVCGYLNLLVPPENSLNELSSILSGYYMGNQTAITGNFISDFDTTLEAGYYSYATSMKTKNIPPNCGYGVVVVIVGSVEQGQISYNNLNNWIWQIAYDTSGIVTMRYAVDSDWSSWNVMATTSNETFENSTLTGNITNNGVITCEGGNAGINFSTTDGKYNIGFSAEGNEDEFIFYDNTNNEGVMSYSPVSKELNLNGTINNNGILNGGNYINPTINEAQLTGSVTLVGGTGIQGGAICNTTFSETIKNEATIIGGTYKDSYLVTPSLNVPTLNNSILPGTTNLNGIMRINEHTGAVYYLDNNSNPCIEEAIDGATWFLRNKYTEKNLITCTPVESGIDTIDINSNIQFNNTITGGTYSVPTISGANFINETSVNGPINIENSQGILNFQNSQNKNMISLNPYNDTFQFKNMLTNNEIFSITPVDSGVDTINFASNIDVNSGLNISESGGVNYNNKQGTKIINKGVFGDTYKCVNLLTNNPMISVKPVSSGYDTIQLTSNIVFNEQGGNLYFSNSNGENIIEQTVNNNEFSFLNTITNNNIFSLTPVENGLDTVNIDANIVENQDIIINPTGGLHFKSNSNGNNYDIACGYAPNNNTFAIWDANDWSPLVEMSANNPNLINLNTELNINNTLNLQNGLYVNNKAITTNESGINGTVPATPDVNVNYNIQYWTLSGGQLAGVNSNMVQLGILQVAITPQETYTWPTGNAIKLSYKQIPYLGAQPLTQVTWDKNHTLFNNDPFTTSLQKGNIVLDGTGWTLNAGKQYTMYALVFGNY